MSIENVSSKIEHFDAQETSQESATKSSESTRPTSTDGVQKPYIPEITIQEIIPEIKEIPITGPPKREINQGSFSAEHTDRSDVEIDNNHNDLLIDSDVDSSEVQENYHQPPPVLRIGDKLLFLKKGEFVSEKGASTPSPVITIIGAEGLQRGFEESLEAHELKIVEKDISSLNAKEISSLKAEDITSFKSVTPKSEEGHRMEDKSDGKATIKIRIHYNIIL